MKTKEKIRKLLAAENTILKLYPNDDYITGCRDTLQWVLDE